MHQEMRGLRNISYESLKKHASWHLRELESHLQAFVINYFEVCGNYLYVIICLSDTFSLCNTTSDFRIFHVGYFLLLKVENAFLTFYALLKFSVPFYVFWLNPAANKRLRSIKAPKPQAESLRPWILPCQQTIYSIRCHCHTWFVTIIGKNVYRQAETVFRTPGDPTQIVISIKQLQAVN